MIMSDSCLAVVVFFFSMKLLKGQEYGKKYGEEEVNLQNLIAQKRLSKHRPIILSLNRK